MKKLMGFIALLGIILAIFGCGKEEVPVEPNVKSDLKSASKHVESAAIEFKATADETAREVGETIKSFGSDLKNSFRKAKDDLEN